MGIYKLCIKFKEKRNTLSLKRTGSCVRGFGFHVRYLAGTARLMV